MAAAEAPSAAAVAALRAALRRPVPAALSRWAEELADASADTSLLGTSLRAPRYEALLWNGARVPGCALAVTGVLTAEPHRTVADLGRAVTAGAAVVAAAAGAAAPGPLTASLDTLGCAVVAALLGPLGGARLDDVIDMAASLMVLGAPQAPIGAERLQLLRAGHPVASGWLAGRAVAAGIAPLRGGAETTLTTVAGAPLDPVPEPAPDEPIGHLLASLR